MPIALAANGRKRPSWGIGPGGRGGVFTPGAISDLVALDATETTIELFFTASTFAVSHEYRVNAGAYSALAANRIITGLTTGTSYTIEVRGVNASGNGAASNSVVQLTVAAIAGAGTITTAQAGNWSATATWTGGVVPVYGKTVTINHDVTVDKPVCIGQSGAPTNADRSAGAAATLAITVATTKTLTVASNVAIRARGDVVLSGTGRLVQSSGSVFVFDGSKAATPATAAYVVGIGDGHNSTPLWKVNGLSTARCRVYSDVGGANGNAIADYGGGGGWLQAGLCDWLHCDTLRMGSASVAAIRSNVSASTTHSISNAVFDACGSAFATQLNLGTTCTWTLSSVTTKNSVGTISVDIGNSGYSSGARTMSGCVWDKLVRFFSPVGIDLSGTLFDGGMDTTAGDFKTWDGNFGHLSDTALFNTWNLYGVIQNSYFAYDSGGGNPHFIQVLASGTPNTTQSVLGCVFEYLATGAASDSGDCINISTPAGARSVTIKNNYILPTQNGLDASGTLFSALGGSTCTITVEHNTAFCSSSLGNGGVAVGETYAGHAGMVASLKSNLFYGVSTNKQYKVIDSPTDNPMIDLVSAANCNYNGGFNLLSGLIKLNSRAMTMAVGTPGVVTETAHGRVANSTLQFMTPGALLTGASPSTTYFVKTVLDANTYTISLTSGGAAINFSGTQSGSHIVSDVPAAATAGGYHQLEFSTSTQPGVNDVSGDPILFDGTRRLSTWDASLGGPGTTANAFAQLRKRNDASGYNSAYNIAALVTYIKTGHTATASGYLTSAHDGTRIGAVA